MKDFKPKSSYSRPQFSILWAGVACTCLCVLFAVVAATGTDPLTLLAGSGIVILTCGLLAAVIEVASRIIPFARRDTQSISRQERRAHFQDYERRLSAEERAPGSYEAASPFGPSPGGGNPFARNE